MLGLLRVINFETHLIYEPLNMNYTKTCSFQVLVSISEFSPHEFSPP